MRIGEVESGLSRIMRSGDVGSGSSRITNSRVYRCLLVFATVCCMSADIARAATQDDFFNDATLQEVHLAINTRDWDTLKAHDDENTYYPADLTWNNVTVRNVGIRSRGKGTRNGIKPGLRVDINRYISNSRFLGLKAFILDNAYSDSTLLREPVTMKMFARMNMPAPREAHARLYINNEFVGAYVIVESIDNTFISRLFGAREGAVETGGYLFEYEHVAIYDMEYLGPDLREYAGMFRPQTRDTDSLVSIYTPIEEMIRTINEAPDEDFAAAVGQYLDLQQFMKYLAIETFMGEADGFLGFAAMNNFYLYRFQQDGRSQLIPWDKDAALQGVDTPVTFRMDTNVLVRRAMIVPELRQTFLDTLTQCITIAMEPGGPDDPRGWLEREADRQASQIAAAVVEDPVYPFSPSLFQDDVSMLEDFGRSRPVYVTCEVARMGDPSGSEESCAHVLDADR
jgi:spore coat protein CotH